MFSQQRQEPNVNIDCRIERKVMSLSIVILSGCYMGYGLDITYKDTAEPPDDDVGAIEGIGSGSNGSGSNGSGSNGSGSNGSGSNGSGSSNAGNQPSAEPGSPATNDPSSIIQSITPTFGSTVGATQVLISGGPYDSATTVLFNGVEASIISQSETSIRVYSPPSPYEGPVNIMVTTSIDSHNYPAGFFYFADGSGQIGAIGSLRYYTLMGSYWQDQYGNPVTWEEGDARITFTTPYDIHWWELLSPTMDSCSPDSYLYSGQLSIYDLQESVIYLEGSHGVSFPLFWDASDNFYNSSILSSNHLPSSTVYNLLPFTGSMTDFAINSIAITSTPTTIYTPALQGASPPYISQNQSFSWAPTGADWISITIALKDSSNSNYIEAVNCVAEDDGSFTVQGSWFNQWTVGNQVDVFFGRAIEQTTILPHNNAEAKIAGEYILLGGGIAQ